MIKCLISDFSQVVKNEKFIQSIRKSYREGKILFIPSTPNNKIITNKNITEIVALFNNNGFLFSDADYIDERSDIKKLKEEINQYSIIFLMGGVTLQQNGFISALEIKDIFYDYTGIVIGLSAGALNMCKQSLLTPIHEEGNQENLILAGLGLVDITVEVHFDVNNQIQREFIQETGLKVYCIPNDSAIIIEENVILICGELYLYDSKVIRKLEEKSYE